MPAAPTRPAALTFGEYTVAYQPVDADDTQPWVLHEVGDPDAVYDAFATRAEAIKSAKQIVKEARIEELVDAISEVTGECQSIERLEAALAVLKGRMVAVAK